MAIISVTTNSRNTSLTGTREIVSKAQVITWSFALALEAVVIVVGNLLTIVLFASNKKLRTKKSLYLVLNMAFADLVLGGVCLPTSVYVLGTCNRLSQELTTPTSFLKIVVTVFSQASLITAALISAERFYAIYWPLKHRTLTSRANKLVILTVWIVATLFHTVYLLPFFTPLAVYTFVSFYALFLVLTICGFNIGIWRKCQQKTTSHHQNRALQNQRLTKALILVSISTSCSWFPTIIYNLISIFGYKMSENIFLLTLFIHFTSSFINPIVYALRIPESRQSLDFFCFRRREVKHSKGNTRRADIASNHNKVQLTFEREIVEDTKL